MNCVVFGQQVNYESMFDALAIKFWKYMGLGHPWPIHHLA